MIASLPMYWRQETASDWQTFWSLVQNEIDAPDLTPPENLPSNWYDHWRDPALLLSMTCSLPFRTLLKGQVKYVGTLDFGLGLEDGYYASQLIARTDLRDKKDAVVFAFNSQDSQSGWAARDGMNLKIRKTLETGSHAASLHAVSEGRADVALIDAVSWLILQRHDPKAQTVKELGLSKPSPSLPLITSLSNDPAALAQAISAACRAFKPEDPMRMGGPLRFVELDEAEYLSLPLPKHLPF